MDHIRPAWCPVAAWPIRVGVVPPVAGCFRQRSAAAAVEPAFRAAGSAASPRVRVLSGLGGVGKTQLAVHYAEQQWACHAVDLLVWVTATSKEAILTAYAETALHVLGIQEGSPVQAAARLLAWLATTDKPWLVALDDMQNPADAHGLWPPTTRSGEILVTTRRRDAALTRLGRAMVDIDVFTSEESLTYLRDALADAPHLADGAAELTADLGHLPLALAQVVAYMIDRDLSCREYRTRLADRRRKLADLLPARGELPDDHRDTATATWSLSVDLANDLAPAGLARPLLAIASLLDPNGCPFSVFTSRAILTHLRTVVHHGVAVDDVRDALHSLHRLSLINIDRRQPDRTVRIHALVQRATRETFAYSDLDDLTEIVSNALLEVWPHVESDNQLALTLRSNAEALRANTGRFLWDHERYRVLFRVAQSLGEAGLASTAATYYQALRADADQYLRPDSRQVLTAHREHARWQGEAGDPVAAVTALDPLLVNYQRILGANDPDTLNLRGHLGYWQRKAGRTTDAVTTYEELLAANVAVLGPDHPDTLSVRANLAIWQAEDGNPAAAVAAIKVLLMDLDRALGPDNIQTLWNRGNLAYWQGQTGDITTACIAFRTLADDHVRVLGPNHPHTLGTRSSAAEWKGRSGEADHAVLEYRALLNDYQRVLGPDHPKTVETRKRLVYWSAKIGDAN